MTRHHTLTTILVGACALAAAAGCRSRSDAGSGTGTTSGTTSGATGGATGTTGATGNTGSGAAVDDATMGSSMSSADAEARGTTGTAGTAAGTNAANDDARLENELKALSARIDTTWEALKSETADGSRRLSDDTRAKWTTTLAELRRERDQLKARIDARGETATSTAGGKIRSALSTTERELDELGQRLDAAFR